MRCLTVFFIVLSAIISSCNNQSCRSDNTQNKQSKSSIKLIDTSTKIPIPEGYELLDSAIGYLNSDSLQDLIIILKRYNEDSLVNETDSPINRVFLILEKTHDNTYVITRTNKTAVYELHSGGARYNDPYYKTTIENQRFTITHLYGGGPLISERHTTFEFSTSDNDWVMLQDEYRDIDLNEITNDTTPIENYRKIKIKRPRNKEKVFFVDFDIYKEYTN